MDMDKEKIAQALETNKVVYLSLEVISEINSKLPSATNWEMQNRNRPYVYVAIVKETSMSMVDSGSMSALYSLQAVQYVELAFVAEYKGRGEAEWICQSHLIIVK